MLGIEGHTTISVPLCSGSPAKLLSTTEIGDGTTYTFRFTLVALLQVV